MAEPAPSARDPRAARRAERAAAATATANQAPVMRNDSEGQIQIIQDAQKELSDQGGIVSLVNSSKV